MSITGITKSIADFYDDKGDYIASKSFSNIVSTFEFNGGTYNAHHKKASNFIIKRWYWNVRHYHYNIGNPDPFVLSKTPTPILNPEMYNIQLQNHVARDLNNAKKKKLLNLDFKTIAIGIIIIVVIYLVITGKIKL